MTVSSTLACSAKEAKTSSNQTAVLQDACLSPSIRLNHEAIWFQLAKVWVAALDDFRKLAERVGFGLSAIL